LYEFLYGFRAKPTKYQLFAMAPRLRLCWLFEIPFQKENDMNTFHRRLRIVPVAVLAMGMSTSFFAARAEGQVPDSEQVSNLLSDVKTQAVKLSADASTMESYTRSGASWESHSAAVNQMKEHINEAGRQLTKLQEVRESASPWQKTAINRIYPLLKELADNTTNVIQYIKDNPKRLMSPGYKEYIEANADTSSRLASLIGDFQDYGNTKQRLEALASKLELEPEPNQ
jgi:hypothetical protein